MMGKKQYALWMPKGSVRALITFSLIGLLGLTIYFDVGESSMAVIAGLTGSATTFYFSSRKTEDRRDQENDNP